MQRGRSTLIEKHRTFDAFACTLCELCVLCGKIFPSSLKNRHTAYRHLQHDRRHRRAVLCADRIDPRAVRLLPLDERIANRRIPPFPPLAAGLPHRLHRVVLAVEEMDVLVRRLYRAAKTGRGISDPARSPALHKCPRCTAPPRPPPNAETGSRPPAACNEIRRRGSGSCFTYSTQLSTVSFGTLQARVPRRPQRHHLADRHGNVRVRSPRLISPTALLVLRPHDQVDGLATACRASRRAATCHTLRPETASRIRARTSARDSPRRPPR